MKLFSALYDAALRWSRHRRAPTFLAGLSFAESSFFPIPPDVMLIPMCLAQPSRAIRLAMLTTIASVLGGMLGYAIGMFALEWVTPLIEEGGRYAHAYSRASEWFDNWGFWAVLVAGFSPIPYKVFTIAAGTLGMPFLPFILASIVGRGGRFFLVASLLRWGGERMEEKIRIHVERIGWFMVALIVVAWFVIRG